MNKHINPQLLRVGILLLLSAGIGFQTAAQTEVIATDRPDQTEAASLVGRHVFQIETGVVISQISPQYYQSAEYYTTRDYATSLFRYGVSDRVELRLATGYRELEIPPPFHGSARGMLPIVLGAKVAVAEERGVWPQVAFLGHLSLPIIAEDDFVPEHLAPDFRFSFAHTLSDRFSLGYNLGMAWDGSDPGAEWIYTLAFGASLIGPVSAFAEVYGEGDGGRAEHSIDFGFTTLVTPDLQLDVSYGRTIHGLDPSWFFNAGISYRIVPRSKSSK